MMKQRAFLKWAGGKYGLIDNITQLLPQGKRLVEPFVGAGSVFLNTDYEEYLLNDVNQDLINLYQLMQTNSADYIKESQKFFVSEFNTSERYYDIRAQFNATSDPFERSLFFLYMNLQKTIFGLELEELVFVSIIKKKILILGIIKRKV